MKMTKDAVRAQAKTDGMFLGRLLGYDFQDDVHPAMFDTLRKNPKHPWRLILWPRGHFKTTAVTVDIVQNILNNPNARLLVMCANLKLTKAWIREIKGHFSGRNTKSRLLEFFPDFKILEGDAEGFTVDARTRHELRQRTVTAASPKAASTGAHFDDGYFDDLVNQNNYRNVEIQDQLESDFNLYQPLIDPGGNTTVTGTRYSFADLYQRIIKANLHGEWLVSLKKCFKEDGSILFPKRRVPDPSKPNGYREIGVDKELLDRLRTADPVNFAAQYLNEILVGEKQMFPEHLLLSAVRPLTDPEFPKLAPTYFFVDLAESKKAESDHSVIVVAKMDGRGRLWVIDVVGHTWTTSQLTGILLQQILLHHPHRVYIEKQPGATFFEEHVRVMGQHRGISVPTELVPGSRQKDAKYVRISSLETFFKSKKIFLCVGIRDFDRLVEEFVQFPKGRHDDRPDAIASLVAKLAARLTPVATTGALQSPWFVQSILAEMEAENVQPSRSLCGDGFV